MIEYLTIRDILDNLETLFIILIPDRTVLVRFGGISREFGRVMVCILARRSRAKIPIARSNETDMPPKRTKKVRLGIYRTQIRFIIYAKRREETQIRLSSSKIVSGVPIVDVDV